MREAGRIEVEPDTQRLRPVDPSGEVLRADGVAIDAARSELAVERVQVEAMRARDQRQRLRRVRAQLVRCSRLARIVAGRGQAAAEFAVRLLEPRDVVSLPAVKRNRHRLQLTLRRVGVHAEIRVALPGEAIGAQYVFSHMFLNSTFMGGPTWHWNPIRPFSARPLVSSSTSTLVTWPLRISVSMLPRATMWTWFQSFCLTSAFSSSSVRCSAPTTFGAPSCPM